MDIRALTRAEWAGRELTFAYETPGYYDVRRKIHPQGAALTLTYTPFPTPVKKSFTSCLFEPHWEFPAAFGAFEGETLLGVIEGTVESWNNRFRVTNLLVLEPYRRRGVGAALMDRALEEARARGCRMAVLETQSCNVHAIAFYRSRGFALMGLDLFCYSNRDPEKKEVRLELGLALKEETT